MEVSAEYLQPLHAFVPAGHPLARGREIGLQELLDFDHVLPDASFGISQLVTRIARKDRGRVAPKMTGNTLQLLRTFAILNQAVVFLPVQAASNELADGTLAPVNLHCDAFANRKLAIAVRKQRALAPAAQLFSGFASARFDAWQDRDTAALAAAQARHWG